MKKFLIFAALAMLIAPNAFASKARLISLGQNPDGSSYVDDSRSLFLNPAYINMLGDFANFEFGNQAGSSAATPNSEGGFFHKWGAYHVGLQLGRQSDFNAVVADLGTFNGSTFVNPQNTIELQIGSGSSLKWGVSLIYGMTESRAGAATQKASTYEIHGGIKRDKIDAYAAVDMFSRADNDFGAGTNTLTLNPSFKLGAGYEFSNEEKFYLESRFMNYKASPGNAGADTTASMNDISVGYAHFLNPDAATKFFYSAALAYTNNSNATLKSTSIPLVVGLETIATDWLKLRGSVMQNVVLDQKVTRVTNTNNPNSTTVSGGVGINWKKVSIDGTLAGTAGGNTAPGSGQGGQGRIDGNNFLANASMTYMF